MVMTCNVGGSESKDSGRSMNIVRKFYRQESSLKPSNVVVVYSASKELVTRGPTASPRSDKGTGSRLRTTEMTDMSLTRVRTNHLLRVSDAVTVLSRPGPSLNLDLRVGRPVANRHAHGFNWPCDEPCRACVRVTNGNIRDVLALSARGRASIAARQNAFTVAVLDLRSSYKEAYGQITAFYRSDHTNDIDGYYFTEIDRSVAERLPPLHYYVLRLCRVTDAVAMWRL
ncbi:hypothetical protein EVAR_52140_1 [Eumeta japonica]|uniref:Uncharacterized protein n=1 Tax=Eumeta variegata TaxID=151549 RepID=A0A4C2A5N5_EUMVA|nr:hypothetical protein EVAR_52140_1 [Eumeta japonica]